MHIAYMTRAGDHASDGWATNRDDPTTGMPSRGPKTHTRSNGTTDPLGQKMLSPIENPLLVLVSLTYFLWLVAPREGRGEVARGSLPRLQGRIAHSGTVVVFPWSRRR